MSRYTSADFEAYLDEALPADVMAEIEKALRTDPELCTRLSAINARRDAGVHTLGGIWRHFRVTCPTREQLGSYLLGVESDELADYIVFHAEVAGCRACQANLADLRAQQHEAADTITARRRKYFQSSAGHLPRK